MGSNTAPRRGLENCCTFLLLMLITAVISNAAFGQLNPSAWPKFRGNAAGTALAPVSGPSTASIKWSYLTGAAISSSPAIDSAGNIYFVSRDQYLYALNSDGTLRWRHNVQSTSDSSPAVASDGTVYVGSTDYYLYAINPDGTRKWRKGLGRQIKASPAIGSNGTIYIGNTNTTMFAINPADGATLWTYNAGNAINSSAALDASGNIYFGCRDSYIYCLNPNGTLKWKYRAASWVDTSPAVMPDGTVYAGSGDGRLYAVKSPGVLVWSYNVGAGIYSSPAVGPTGTIYFGADNNKIYAVNPDGSLKWTYSTGGTIPGSPAVGADGVVYVGSMDNKLYAINPNGTLLWQYTFGDKVYSSPAIGNDGALYVGAYDSRLYAFFRDDTPPTTPVVSHPSSFSNSATSLSASWLATDSESGIGQYQYAIGTTPGAVNVAGWTSAGTNTSVTHTGLTLTHNQVYYFAVKAQNTSGLWSEVGVSDGVLVDLTPPSTPVVSDNGPYTSNSTSLSASWSASGDPESGIVEYQYAVGAAPGAQDVVGWTSAGLNTSVTRTGLNLTSGQTYYISVRAFNGAGSWSATGISPGITVDTSPPSSPSVTDEGQFTASSNSLSATWTAASDAQSGINGYEYAIGTASGGVDVVGWAWVGLSTSVTKTGLSLTDGVTYYISVRATNGAGLIGSPGVSDGIKADASAPTTPSVTDEGQFTQSPTTLQASWSASDPHSGIAEYQYAIGTSPGASNVVAWTSSGLNTSVTRSSLSLQDGVTYYFSVRARNGAGLWSAVGSSDGITCDSSPPGAPIVIDDGVFTSSTNTLHAVWSASDPHSGIAEYQYAIGTTAGGTNLVNWTSTGTTAEVTRTGLFLTNGSTYYISVKARNGSGLWSTVGSSDGITVDNTPPSTPAVSVDGPYTTNNTSLHAVWTAATDAQSGISGYEYAIGTTAGGTNVVGWTSVGLTQEVTRTGLNLTDGVTYYFTVRARNGAGLTGTAGVSSGIMVDSSPPTTPAVTDDGQFTSSSTSLRAVWTSSDPHSGIVENQYAIGTSPGAQDVVSWTSTGLTASVTKTGLNLTDGLTYYFSVRTRNAAGLWSLSGVSDGIVADSSAPPAPVVTDDGVFTSSTNTLHAVWSASDPHSGIAEYQYAIGTSAGATNIVNWTSTGSTAEVTRTGLSLVNGSTYYISVRARNGSGLWSAVGSSDGITVDVTPPSTPTVSVPGPYTTSKTTLSASWTAAADAQSGISEYEYAIGTTAGGTNIVNWTSAGAALEVTRTGLSLTDGVTYYFAVRAKNGAGLAGTPGLSSGVTVDSSAPGSPVVTDGGPYVTVNNSLSASWTAAVDPHTPVVEYQYAIGTSPGMQNIVGWTSAGASTSVTRTGLNLADGVIYYFAVRARNAAGLWGAPGISAGVTVDTSPPGAPTVTDQGPYSSETTILSASWSATDPHSGIAQYQYAIGTSPGAEDVVPYTSVGGALSVTRTGLNLVNGVTYYFSVKARNGAGLWSAAGTSAGTTIETTPPLTPEVTDDGDSQIQTDSIHASWISSDPESGIAEYQYAIGTSPGGTNIVGWTSAGTNTEVTHSGLNLLDGVIYYVSVKARNRAGLWSAVGYSDGIEVVTGWVWPMFRYDPRHRGVSPFSGSQVGAILWQYPTAGYVESAPAISGDGTIYFGSGDGALYALTNRGRLRWKFQTGGPIDSSPAIGQGGVLYFGSFDGKIYSLNSNGTLRWSYETGDMVWSSPVIGQDGTIYIGGLDGYLYALNPTGSLRWRYNANTRIWSSPAIDENGVIYFGGNDGYIYAINPNGTLKWRFLTQTAVDSSPTISSDGTVYVGSGDGYFYAINPNGTLKWKYWTAWAVDSTAAIGHDGTIYVGVGHDWAYGYLVALNPNGTEKWLFDAKGHVRSSPAIGSDGLIYFGSGGGSVFCITPSGQQRWSYNTGWPVLSSPAISRDGMVCVGSYSGALLAFKDSAIPDDTPPTTPVVRVPNVISTSTASISASWFSEDLESDVAEYKFCLGTWPNSDDVHPWTSVGTAESIMLNNLNLMQGVSYYFSVQARNTARMWSNVGVSPGVLIVPPGTPTSIGVAKRMPDNTLVNLTGKIRTMTLAQSLYVQEPDRSAGIKVLTDGFVVPLSGDIMTIGGHVETDASGERAVRMATYSCSPDSIAPVTPYTLLNKMLGGGPVAPGYPFVNGGTGADNTGLLVCAWGKVSNATSTQFYINDGSGAKEADGTPGVKVSLTGLVSGQSIQAPPNNVWVKVTGISSMEPVPGGYRRVLKPRKQADIVVQ